MPGTVIDLLMKPGDKVQKAIGRLVGHENGNGRPVALHRFDLSIANLIFIFFNFNL